MQAFPAYMWAFRLPDQNFWLCQSSLASLCHGSSLPNGDFSMSTSGKEGKRTSWEEGNREEGMFGSGRKNYCRVELEQGPMIRSPFVVLDEFPFFAAWCITDFRGGRMQNFRGGRKQRGGFSSSLRDAVIFSLSRCDDFLLSSEVRHLLNKGEQQREIVNMYGTRILSHSGLNIWASPVDKSAADYNFDLKWRGLKRSWLWSSYGNAYILVYMIA